jgi:hypothetical protein
MFFQKTHDRRNAVTVMCGLFLLTAPAQALNDGDLQRAILDAKALGDTGASVKTDGTTVMVTTYLTPKDTISTCKAKGVLVAKTLFDKVKTLALVRLVFFVPNNTRQYVSVEVGEGAIKSFAAGQTTMTKLIASIPYQDTRTRSQSTTSTAAAGSSKGLRGLVQPTGTVDIGKRQAQISYMQACQAQGIDVSNAVQEFNLEQTCIDSSDTKGYTQHFNNCSMLIDGYNQTITNREQPGSTSAPVKSGRFGGERTTLWQRLIEVKKSSRFTDTQKGNFQMRFDSIENMVNNESTTNESMAAMIQNLYSQMK